MSAQETIKELLEALKLAENSDQIGAPMDLGECVLVLRGELPGFWWRGGTCALSSEVIIAPDYNDPEHRERLLREFPVEMKHWDAGIEVELRPGTEWNLCRAFLATIIRAKLAQREVFPKSQWEDTTP